MLQRCNYTCQLSGVTIATHRIEAHHLESYAHNSALRFDPDNGIALSIREHVLFHEWMGGIHVRCTRADFERYRTVRLTELMIYNR